MGTAPTERNRLATPLHPRKREHRVPEKTEDHDVSPDQKLRSGSQSRSRRDILPPPRHDRGTGVVAGVEIPAGCAAVAAMELDQQERQEQDSNRGAEKDDIPGPQSMLDQGNSRQTTEDGHQRVDHKPLMPANGLDGHGAESRRGEFVRRIEVRIKQRRSRIVVHVATVSSLAPGTADTTDAASRGLPLHSRITLTQAAGDSPRKPTQARLTGLFE